MQTLNRILRLLSVATLVAFPGAAFAADWHAAFPTSTLPSWVDGTGQRYMVVGT